MAGGEGVELETVAELEAINLYQRATICRTFPAYTLESLRNAPARELLQAIRLLDIAARVPHGGGGHDPTL